MAALGVVLADRGRTGEAIETLQGAVAADPGNPAVHLRLARLLTGEGRLQEAAASYDEVVAREPSGVAYRELAAVLQRLGRPLEAEKSLVRAGALDKAPE